MAEQNENEHPQSRVKRGPNTFNYIASVIVVLFVVSFYFYVQKSPSISSTNNVKSHAGVGETQLPKQTISQSPGLVTKTNEEHTSDEVLQPEEGLPYSDNDDLLNTQPTNQVNSLMLKAGADQINQPPSTENNYQHLIDEINSFYAHLDKQPYMRSFSLKESSKIHFSKLLQKLVDNPPVLIGETNDLYTLLQNTAHFFRILGKNNINILKAILQSENNSFELILKAFYGLTYTPEHLKKEYSLSIPPNALTDYAAFFLNTIGGRLYLFRRDSTSRLVVSYYSIISIDRANSEGNGGHGIDLRPAIHSLVEEIEIGGGRLQLKDDYLDTLYDLQEKYY